MKNIVLIGMPSSGKSTVGKELSERLGLEFTDTDALILEKAGKPLRDIVREDGLAKFLELQQDTLLQLNITGHVIATGGSVVFGDASMQHLKKSSIVVFLETGIHELEQRLTPDRRLARNQGQTYEEVFNERQPLYRKYADMTIDCTGRTVEDIAEEIIKLI